MSGSLSLVLCVVLGSTALGAANREQGRLENCGLVMQEILDIPDNIPQELLEKAECVIVINRGAEALLSSTVKLGASMSAAAGPKGRNAEASTDVTMRAEILGYSRARGLFAGVSLEGTSLRPDDDASEQVYGRSLTARSIVMGDKASVPESGRHLVSVLEKNAPHNESQKTTGN